MDWVADIRGICTQGRLTRVPPGVWPLGARVSLPSGTAGICQIPPDYVVKSQASDITGIIPTVSLGVTSAVVSSCGHDSGHIEPLVAHELAGHWATHAGPAECPPHRPPPHAQPLAPVRQYHGRHPRLIPRGCTDQTPPSDEGQPCGRIREEKRSHRLTMPREALPRRRSSFRLLAMASPYWRIYVNY